jgi:CPA2 family monovalent cation:H+ antiporter-2
MAASINIPVYSDALVVLATAGIIVPLAQRWGVSPVLGYLVAGAILGPLGLGSLIDQLPVLRWFTVTDAKNVSGIADLGVVFLLFLIGLELSLDRLMAMRRLVFGLGALQIGLSTILISGALALIGHTAPIAMLLGACLAMSSTAMALEVLSKQGRLTTAADGRASQFSSHRIWPSFRFWSSSRSPVAIPVRRLIALWPKLSLRPRWR